MMAQSKALRGMWMSVSAEDSAAMVDLLDLDHDGRISLDELRRFVYLLPEAQVRTACVGNLADLLESMCAPVQSLQIICISEALAVLSSGLAACK